MTFKRRRRLEKAASEQGLRLRFLFYALPVYRDESRRSFVAIRHDMSAMLATKVSRVRREIIDISRRNFAKTPGDFVTSARGNQVSRKPDCNRFKSGLLSPQS